jgi:hypothetical protein
MSFFAADGVFVGLDGTEHKGTDDVRAALGAPGARPRAIRRAR